MTRARSPRAAAACAAFVALRLLTGCKSASQPPAYPGSLVEIAARVRSGDARAARVSASVDGNAAATLHGGTSAGEWHGALAVAPGRHRLKIEAFDESAGSLGATALEVPVAKGQVARIDATVGRAGSADARAAVAAIVSPRGSVVAGDRIVLQGRTTGPQNTAVAWTTDPEGCGRFAEPRAVSTEWTAAVPGTCKVALTATNAGQSDRRSVSIVVRTRGASYAYPLQVAPGGRHLVDQRGTPFLIKGETAWLALVNLTEAEQERYLADRGAKGFNLVEVMLVNHDYTSSPNPSPPANRAGEEPFRKPGDFSTPSDAYFDRAAAFVDRAAAHGITVLLAPVYLGFDGGREGWWSELTAPANTRAVCAAFGRYLGARFKSKKNLLWLAGGDYAPPAGSEGEARHWEILAGIREAAASQLWTGHWNFQHGGGISTDEARFRDAMALNGVYQYATPYRDASRAFALAPQKPVFLLESTYEHEHPRSDTQPFRKAWWWTMLSGGSGVLWSNAFLWLSESARGTYRMEYGDVDHAVSSWSAELESAGTFEIVHLHALFEGLPWHRLIPAGIDGGLPALITSGQRRGQDHIAAAATPEGDLVVAYVPPSRTSSRSFAVDLSRMHSGGAARWYDPSTGGSIPLPGNLPRSAAVELKTPGTNGGGANDWVLVVEAVGGRK